MGQTFWYVFFVQTNFRHIYIYILYTCVVFHFIYIYILNHWAGVYHLNCAYCLTKSTFVPLNHCKSHCLFLNFTKAIFAVESLIGGFAHLSEISTIQKKECLVEVEMTISVFLVLGWLKPPNIICRLGIYLVNWYWHIMMADLWWVILCWCVKSFRLNGCW